MQLQTIKPVWPCDCSPRCHSAFAELYLDTCNSCGLVMQPPSLTYYSRATVLRFISQNAERQTKTQDIQSPRSISIHSDATQTFRNRPHCLSTTVNHPTLVIRCISNRYQPGLRASSIVSGSDRGGSTYLGLNAHSFSHMRLEDTSICSRNSIHKGNIPLPG